MKTRLVNRLAHMTAAAMIIITCFSFGCASKEPQSGVRFSITPEQYRAGVFQAESSDRLMVHVFDAHRFSYAFVVSEEGKKFLVIAERALYLQIEEFARLQRLEFEICASYEQAASADYAILYTVTQDKEVSGQSVILIDA